MKFVLGTLLVLTFSAFYVHAVSISILQNQQQFQNIANQILNQAQILINNINNQNLQNLAQSLLNQAQQVLNSGNSKDLTEIITTLNQVIQIAGPIIGVISGLFGKRDLEARQLQNLFDSFQGLQGTATELVQNLFGQLLGALTGALGGINIGKRGLQLNSQNILQLAQQYGPQALQQINTLIGSLPQNIQQSIQHIINSLLNGNSKDLLSNILASLGLGSLLSGDVNTIINNLLNAGLNHLVPLVTGIIGKRDLESTKILDNLTQLFGEFQGLGANLLNVAFSTLFQALNGNPTLTSLLGSLGKRQRPSNGF